MKNDLKTRNKKFAHQCVKLSIDFPNTDLGFHIKKQLIRCCTSVAANYRAASLAQTKKGFISKLSIVIEEADECIFWIEFAKDENLIINCENILNEAKELTSIFIASRKTAQKTVKR
ncbi:four helix bundle protein [Mesonia aquimarina]|uniref:four helix bundle protein n=1 Tax=Mesonia aquimarina TaxID=1504967 RepID=UPI000EF62DF1|nr:four helix bundle protein [Mesonia aquimarina]